MPPSAQPITKRSRHFERGLATLAALPEGPARDGREIELQLARGLSLFTTEGFGAAGRSKSIPGPASSPSERGDPHQLFMAVYGLWQSANGRGGMAECRKFSHRLQQLTADDADEELRLQAHHSAWTTCLFSGEPAAAREHCEAGRRLYDPERHRHHRQLYGGHDPGACAGYMGAQAHWLLGYPDTGLAIGREALALAERIAHPFTLGATLVMNAMLHLDRDEPEVALQRIEAAEALVAEQRIGLVLEPQILRGAVMTAQGAFEEAVACLRDGLSRPRAIRLRPYGLARLAEALARQGDHEAALAAVREAIGGPRTNGAAPVGRRNFIASKASRFSVSTGSKRRKAPSKRRCASRVGNRQSPMNCAPRRASPGCGANRAAAPKRASCWRPFTAGSPRASTPPI